jgi:hypothetical protein
LYAGFTPPPLDELEELDELDELDDEFVAVLPPPLLEQAARMLAATAARPTAMVAFEYLLIRSSPPFT